MAIHTPYHRGPNGRYIHTPFRKITPGRGANRYNIYANTPSNKIRSALALKEQQYEEVCKRLTTCTASKQKLKGKLLELLERQGELKRELQEKVDENDAKTRICDALRNELERASLEAQKRRVEASAEIDALLESTRVKDHAISVLQRDLHTVRACLAGREQGQVSSANLACELRELQNTVNQYAKQIPALENQLQEKNLMLAAAKTEHEELLQKYKALIHSVVSARTALDGAILQSGTAMAAGETKRAVRGFANSIMSLRHSLPTLSVSSSWAGADMACDASSASCQDIGAPLDSDRISIAASERHDSTSSHKSSHSRFTFFKRAEVPTTVNNSTESSSHTSGQRWFRGTSHKDLRRPGQSPNTELLESQVFMPLGGGAMLAR
eukprot:jgi/Botrbrau1/12361/Bobra.0239s0010.1